METYSNGPYGVANVADGAWGRFIRFLLPDGQVLDYCHLSESLPGMGPVERGQVVAKSGHTGIQSVTVFGPHVHVQGWDSLADVQDGNNRVNTEGWFG